MVALWTKLTGEEVPFAKSKVKEQAKEYSRCSSQNTEQKKEDLPAQLKTDDFSVPSHF